MQELPTLLTNEKVQCTQCRNEFETFVDDQAFGCAAHLDERTQTIHGYYGSEVADMMAYKFVSSHAWIEAGPPKPGIICDDCITGLEARGLIEVHEQRHF
jgi:hypothetical protein